MDTRISRRQVLSTAPLIAGAGLIPAAGFAAATAPHANLADPHTRAKVRARIIGSCAKETVFLFYRLNIYGFSGEGGLVPYFTMNNLSINEWTPLPDGTYQNRTVEAGVYCKFNTDEPLDYWDNPLTGQKRKVWQFLGGPFTVTVGADGVVTKGADLRPDSLRMEEFGGMVFVPTAASAAYPNPVSPDKWPKLSSGKTIFWESQATFAAKTADAFNDDLTSAPAFCQFQNLASWQAWMAMTGRPGRTYGKAHGTKLKSLDEIPAAARRTLESHTPEIFDWKNWTKPHFGEQEFLATQKPE